MQVFIQLLPFIMAMMELAEKMFTDKPKSGAEKKEFVIETAKGVSQAIEGMSTGGQKETWGIIGRVIDPFIDLVSGLLHSFGVFKK